MVTAMTSEEWEAVQKALVVGGLRECIDNIIASRFSNPLPAVVSDANRRIIEQAYDDGNGNTLSLIAADDFPWFLGMWEDSEVMLGMEHNGTLYSITHASGGGLVSVIVGRGILDNEVGVTFNRIGEAKAYVKGLTAVT